MVQLEREKLFEEAISITKYQTRYFHGRMQDISTKFSL